MITLVNVTELIQKKRSIANLFNSSLNIELDDNLKNRLIQISEMNTFFNYSDSLLLKDCASIKELKNDGLLLLDKLPKSFGVNYKGIKKELLNIDKYTGENQHQFVASIILLSKLHILAVGAILIAFFIEILVLFCGLLGALPHSYLSMKKFEELETILDYSFVNVFSLELQKDVLYDEPYKTKLHLILSNCKPASMQIAKEGYPAYIEREMIDKLKLSTDIGVLISTLQARKFGETEDVYIRLRFILWASELLKTNRNGE